MTSEAIQPRTHGAPLARLLGGMPVLLFATAWALAWGFSRRHHPLVNPEEGIGYWLGITGASMMLALLLYPLRKHLRVMRRLGPVAWWFRLHMVLGVIGPACILFHCNFSLGSLNSQVALACMVVVASSGLVGRYLYTHIHQGLYGQKLEARQLRESIRSQRAELAGEDAGDEEERDLLAHWEGELLARDRSAFAKLLSPLSVALSARVVRRRMLQLHRQHLERNQMAAADRRRAMKSYRRQIDHYLQSVRSLVTLGLFERLFGLWHMLHLPLFIMLVISGLVHVYAVHVY
ncbi:MAG TPA: pyridine nucleotide-disulfide oxidoreductase [Thiotrichales bacterium]|nr:pyridine nucleotide-disulfide oxidoreductase [Thiotrichales bacterium]